MPAREFWWLMRGLSELSAWRRTIADEPEKVTGDAARSAIARM
jgi:hypothetical protein